MSIPKSAHSVKPHFMCRFIILCLISLMPSLGSASGWKCLQPPASAPNSTDTTPEKLNGFFEKIMNACNTKKPANFFALQTRYMRENSSLAQSPAEQTKWFNQYCEYTYAANRALDGKPENGVHSIDPKRNDDGCNNSVTWYIQNKQGERVFRLKIALEKGVLKIHDH